MAVVEYRKDDFHYLQYEDGVTLPTGHACEDGRARARKPASRNAAALPLCHREQRKEVALLLEPIFTTKSGLRYRLGKYQAPFMERFPRQSSY